MRLLARFGAAVLFGTCAASAAPAALPDRVAPPPSRTVHLRDALRIALDHSPAVLAALARAQAAHAQVDVAAAALLPTLTVSTSPHVAYTDQPYLPTLRFEGVSSNVDGTLAARWPVFDFGRTQDAARASAGGAAAADADARSARESAAIAVASAYVALVTSRSSLASARELLVSREKQGVVVAELVARGIRPSVDGTRMRIDVDRARLELARANAEVAARENQLLSALGFEPAAQLVVDDVLDMDALEVDDDAVRAADRAVARAGEVAAARMRLAQTGAALDGAQAARWPTVTLSTSGSVARTDVLQGLGLGGRSESAQAAAVISWNVFDPAVSGQIASADRLRAAAYHDLDDVIAKVRLAASTTALELRDARSGLGLADDLVQSAQLNLDATRERYGDGVGGLLEVLDAQFALESAQSERLAQVFRLAVATVKLAIMTEGPDRTQALVP
jgi:outer membrane protein